MALQGQPIAEYKPPVVVEIPNLVNIAEQAVLEDLTFSPEKVKGERKWRLGSWMDLPLVMIDGRRFGVTDMLITLGGDGCDEQMLRVASRIDANQYSKVSEVRHDRMIETCIEELQKWGWVAKPKFRLSDPALRELDVFARRGSTTMVLQVKSTLRPETPWEVLKRNEDILEGIDHTASVITLFDKPRYGFVITDGYRGDYDIWRSVLGTGVPVGILSDLGDTNSQSNVKHCTQESRTCLHRSVAPNPRNGKVPGCHRPGNQVCAIGFNSLF
jgi:hypothetical protein